MRDVLVLMIIAAFFALCVAYVRWCDRIIGPDPDGLRDEDGDVELDACVDADLEVEVDHVVADGGVVRT